MPTIIERLRVIVGNDTKPGVLFTKEEVKNGIPSDIILVEGIVRSYGFHPQRLEAARPQIEEIIKEVVKDEFLRSKGGGMSFLQLCEDRNGELWGEHLQMELLCCLAIGLKLGGWCAPRDVWSALPGGMPYVWFEG